MTERPEKGKVIYTETAISIDTGKDERIGVKPAGIISLGRGDQEAHFVIESDHVDSLTAHTVDNVTVRTTLPVVGEKAHLQLPDLDPQKVTFVQVGSNPVTAVEFHRGVKKQSQVKFIIHGVNMVTRDTHESPIEEEEFSHLFLEPESGDTMDFLELEPRNGNTDFLIIHHDQDDPARATIYILAEPAIVIEDGIAKTAAKADIYQFVASIHNMLVATTVPDFEHMPEQDALEAAIIQALANGTLTFRDEKCDTFDNLSRDGAILGFIYRIQTQFALRGRERYKDKRYYGNRLRVLAPFYEKPTQKWYKRLLTEQEDDTVVVDTNRWDELQYDIKGGNNIKVRVSPVEKPKTDKSEWQTRWQVECPLDELGKLSTAEQNDYLANRLLALLHPLREVSPNEVNSDTLTEFKRQLAEFRSLTTTINRSRPPHNNQLDTALEYADFYDKLKIGKFDALHLVPFLHTDDFNLALPKRSRQQIVKHALTRWKNMLTPLRKGLSDVRPHNYMTHLNSVANGSFRPELMNAAKELQKAINQMHNRANVAMSYETQPYILSELIMASKVLFLFAAEYHQLKLADRPTYIQNAWASQLKSALDAVHEIMSDV